ncbi:MAG: multicopper oxidase domain-containing protein [Cryobacterium sp.]|uniref:multicopper oxidase family protein n=1 Tax=unclassified Cryobacterium TaxID=2649013 RepID=UPI0018CAF20C|nr:MULTISPECIES: multicopper oxidase domain-containing protein [unclassified Cryobacterium]MCY7404521.1 multicopper oxidase domain-containing protein [Cryobacterium sp.]MEC5154047.1 FtsP/CotA-like multicopper oxidase with cupredoxin domain [Cryobacterium sp. CAN_C3]
MIFRRFTRPRRRVATLISGAVVGAVVLAVGLTACSSDNGAGVIDTVGTIDFVNPLAIPPLAESTVTDDGERVFDLTAQAGTTEFMPGVVTDTWGYNGSYLGPTLVAERGENVRINVKNHLDEATTVHWHGMNLPAEMDGGPHQMVEPGAEWSPNFSIDQPASTLWYHPHPAGKTEHQVEMGLAGLFLVQDAAEAALTLPRSYGVDDIPVMLQDRRFDANGQFVTDVRGYIGPIGDQLLVNGTRAPYLDVTTEVVRLRLVNGSTARMYDFGFSDGRSFDLIGTDGGLLNEAAAMEGIRLSPGERAEVLVRLVPGETVNLQSTPPDLGTSAGAATRNAGDDTLDVMELRAADTLSSIGAVSTKLASIEPLKKTDASADRSFTLNGYTINNRLMDMARIDETVEAGATEVWTVDNAMPLPHNFHVHAVQFQVLRVGTESPPPELSGWKDTIYLEPGVRYELIMQFAEYTDPNFPYMFHCHMLAHEDAGMMGQFVVVKPGDQAGTPPTAHDAVRSESNLAVGSGPRLLAPTHGH